MKPSIKTCFVFLLLSAASWAGSYGKTQLGNNNDASYMITVPATALATSATDFFEMNGSSSKVVRIQEIIVDWYNNSAYSGYTSTGSVNIIRRSTAASGSGTSVTPAKLDTNNAASSVGSVKYFTANPTVGTLVDTLGRLLVFGRYEVTPRAIFKADTPSQAITLRGTSDYLVLNGNSGFALSNGGTIYYVINLKFTESAN